VIVLKDNVTRTDDVDADEADGSVTRPEKLFMTIFERAGLVIVKKKRQVKFPKSIYPVWMYALRPAVTERESSQHED
jgi:protein N-terminal methyltransferase